MSCITVGSVLGSRRKVVTGPLSPCRTVSTWCWRMGWGGSIAHMWSKVTTRWGWRAGHSPDCRWATSPGTCPHPGRRHAPILFISNPEHFFCSSKLMHKHYYCLYNFVTKRESIPVCRSIEHSRGSPESKECLGIDIQDQACTRLLCPVSSKPAGPIPATQHLSHHCGWPHSWGGGEAGPPQVRLTSNLPYGNWENKIVRTLATMKCQTN